MKAIRLVLALLDLMRGLELLELPLVDDLVETWALNLAI